jgi:S-adenosylmethionine:tRNA ribosyltransferase-isomerase
VTNVKEGNLDFYPSVPPELLRTQSYHFDLPEELIAQVPAEPRDSSRLLVLKRGDGEIEHRSFRDILEYLVPGDLLILNDARVIPARLFGKKASGTARVEVFLLRAIDPGWKKWEAMVRPGRRLQPGTEVLLDGGVPVSIRESLPGGLRIVEFPEMTDVHDFLEKSGQVPLPPYIQNKDIRPDRYQTVYARKEGAVAAPTAGLHFTEGLLQDLSSIGVETAKLTLHVGIGTFRPVKEADIRKHPMHEEFFEIPAETAERVNAARSEKRRVVAVGTTVVRALEAACGEGPRCRAGIDQTRLFIYPGYRFKAIDAMVTNFHLPQSSLLMLVSAFAGYGQTMQAYRTAVKEGYRFFSFGDAMLIA